MTFFESLLVLLLAAIVLLQISRRLGLPYPAMLAAAGVVVALIPGTPTIRLDPSTALALFIAPVLLDAAFDFPAGAAWKLWRPLVVLALGAVLATTATVAFIGWWWAGLPIAAAVTLGAIVAPPDAAAATAVLGSMAVPRTAAGIIKGESLFNDATALVLFSEALYVQRHGGLDAGVGVGIALGVPGGILLGIAAAQLNRWVGLAVNRTLGGNLFQFVNTYLVWIIAEHLHLSAVLAVVAMAMTIARSAAASGNPRMRVQSYAVWSSVVFLLNILAFLLMGMQAREIVGRMPTARLGDALIFAGLVVVAVIVVRMIVVVGYTVLEPRSRRVHRDEEPASWRQAVLTGWSGMRGLLTLATAYALPASFPQRDLIVLTAFGVVLATLVLQGLTLGPLIKLLGLEDHDAIGRELNRARRQLTTAALTTLTGKSGPEVAHVRYGYAAERQSTDDPPDEERLDCIRRLSLAAIAAERRQLEELRLHHAIDGDGYLLLQEELDWRELAQLPEDDRRIEES